MDENYDGDKDRVKFPHSVDKLHVIPLHISGKSSLKGGRRPMGI